MQLTGKNLEWTSDGKYSLINDFSYVALLLSRLEKNFQYYIDKNISEGTIFTIHHQTHYNEDVCITDF